MVYDAKRGQTGIGYVVNAITWFNLLWLHRDSIIAELRAMQPSPQVAEAIRWMEQELPQSRMPMVASRLEEIIDALKMNGKSIDWANDVITEFRQSCPVAPKFWWQGGYQSQGRIPRDRIANGNEPIPVTTAMDVAREQWIEMFQKARRFADKESWRNCWQVPPEIRSFPTRPEAAAAARDFWMFYNRTREAKKTEFLKAGKDHRGKKVTSEQDAGIAAYLYAEEDVHDRIKASGMYLDIYAELVKLVFDRGLTLEPPRNPDGTVKPIADGILGGPHTLDGLLDIPRDSSGKSPGDCALQLPAGRTAELKRSKKVQRIP
jgi:FAD/FMN-containing dehydrogenase